MKLAKTSIALLVIQLAIVSSIAAKYLYERWTCPRVWTRTAMYDPSTLMRGRYLSLQLTVDGCQSTLPSARQATMPRDKDGVPTGKTFQIASLQNIQFSAKLGVKDNKLVAIRIPENDDRPSGLWVEATPGSSCANMRLDSPVDFYIADQGANPAISNGGGELWIEVTLPGKGPPRPIQLARKLPDGTWKPLATQ